MGSPKNTRDQDQAKLASAWSRGATTRTRDDAAGIACAVPPPDITAAKVRDAWMDGYLGRPAPAGT